MIAITSFYKTQQSRLSPTPSPKDGNRSNFWNFVYLEYLDNEQILKTPVIPSYTSCG
jgi:hypothetical protein